MAERGSKYTEPTEEDKDFVLGELAKWGDGAKSWLMDMTYQMHDVREQLLNQARLSSYLQMKCTVLELINANVRLRCESCGHEFGAAVELIEGADIPPGAEPTINLHDIYVAYMHHRMLSGEELPSLDQINAEYPFEEHTAFFGGFVKPLTKAPDDLSELLEEHIDGD